MGADIFTTDHLVLFLAFFIPGFIASQIYGLFIGVDDADFSKRLPIVIGYSTIHYAVTGWIILVAPQGVPREVAAYVVVFFLPLLWTPIILGIRDPEKWRHAFFSKDRTALKGLREQLLSPEPTPWDLIDASPKWVRIRLKSGSYVGGFLAKVQHCPLSPTKGKS